MAISEKQSANIKKIMETLYKYGNKRHLSLLIPSDKNKDLLICYNEAASSLLKKNSVSFVNTTDKSIDGRNFITSFDFKSFLSFNEYNKYFYYNALIEGKDTFINFITIEEYKEISLCEKKVVQLSLNSKITNKEILSNFSINEISYLLTNEKLFYSNFNAFVEVLVS